MTELDNGKLKVYISKPISGKAILPFLTVFSLTQEDGYKKRLFQDIDFTNFKNTVMIEGSVSQSDAILVPHDFAFIKNNKEYLDSVVSLSITHRKKIIVFYHADSSDDVPILNSIVFRTSKYGNHLKDSEIIMPPYVEDLALGREIPKRLKEEFPSVGFVGQASFRGIKHRISYLIKNYIMYSGERRTGLYFRRKIIGIFTTSRQIISKFILRKFYSGHLKSIEGDPVKMRDEYIQNIINSDFILAPKGDGNYSLRFYETLALGRIPILPDTDIKLPLEEVIDYREFILKFNLDSLQESPQMTYEFWKNLSQEQFLDMQFKSRENFEKYLFFPKFLDIVFNRSFLHKYLIK